MILFLALLTADVGDSALSSLSVRMMVDEFLKTGDYESLIAHLDSAYQQTKQPEYLSQEIDHLVAVGKYKKAIEKAKLGMKNHPDIPTFYEHLVRISYNEGSKREAISVLRDMRKRFWDDPHAVHFVGMVFDNYGSSQDAEQAYTRALQLAPDSPAVLLDYISFLIRDKRYSKAMKLFDRTSDLLDKQEENVVVQPGALDITVINKMRYRLHMLWGLCYEKLNGQNDALEHYKTALQYKPNDKNVSLSLARAYLKLGQPDSAADYLWLALTKHHGDPDIIKLLGISYYQSGSFNSGLAYLSAASVLEPADDQTHYYLARCLHSLGHDQKALEEIQKAVRINPSLTNIVYLGFIQIYLGDKDQGAMTLLRATDNGNPDACLLMAATHERYGRNRLAEKYYKKAVQLDPDNPTPLQRLIQFLMSNNRVEDVGPFLERMTQLKDTSADAWYQWAMWLSDQHDIVRADHAFGRVIENIKSDTSWTEDQNKVDFMATTYNNWAYTLSEDTSQLEKALELASTALGLSPDEPAFLDTKAWILFKMGELEQAKQYALRAARMLEEPDPEIYEHLAEIYDKLGQHEEADKWRKKAQESQ